LHSRSNKLVSKGATLSRDILIALLSKQALPAGIVLTGDIELPLELGQVGALVIDSSLRPAARHCKARADIDGDCRLCSWRCLLHTA